MDNLSDIYKEVSKYDLHYSTVRTTVTTFLVSISLSLGFFLLKENLKGAVLFLPLILLIFAFLLSAHYQRLTNSCRKIQEELEDRISCRKCRKNQVKFENRTASVRTSGILSTAPLVKFRQRLAEEYQKTKFIHLDIPNTTLLALTVGYFLFVIHIVVGTSTNISGLEVIGDSGKVAFTWERRGEAKNFILDCLEKGNDNYKPITCLIPYFDKDILLYRFTDNSVKPGGKYDYHLEIVEPDRKGGLKIWKFGE